MKLTLGARAAAALASLIAISPAEANEVITRVPIFAHEPQALTCERWQSARVHRTAETKVIEAWAFGYATAFVSSHVGPRGLSLTEAQLLPLIDEQCRAERHNNYLWTAIAAALEPVVEQTTR